MILETARLANQQCLRFAIGEAEIHSVYSMVAAIKFPSKKLGDSLLYQD